MFDDDYRLFIAAPRYFDRFSFYFDFKTVYILSAENDLFYSWLRNAVSINYNLAWKSDVFFSTSLQIRSPLLTRTTTWKIDEKIFGNVLILLEALGIYVHVVFGGMFWRNCFFFVVCHTPKIKSVLLAETMEWKRPHWREIIESW